MFFGADSLKCFHTGKVSADLLISHMILSVFELSLTILQCRQDEKSGYQPRICRQNNSRPSPTSSTPKMEKIFVRVGAGSNRTGRAGLWETCLKIQRSSSLFRNEIRYEAINKLINAEKIGSISTCEKISIVALIEVSLCQGKSF